MAVQFVLGRAGSGKTHYCLDEIKKSLEVDPAGDPIIYLVPEQMTFQSEYELAQDTKLGGMIRCQVFSITRLAWRVLQETGGIAREHLSSVGIHILLRKIIEERKQDLKVFTKASEKTGFIDQVEEAISEFKRYCISTDDLGNTKADLDRSDQKSPTDELLEGKLHDFDVIYKDFEQAMLGKYLDSEDYLKLLAQNIENSSYIQNAQIYVDGFHSFTPQEVLVLQELMKHCQSTTVCLTGDQEYNETPPHELDLFQLPGNTYRYLYKIANEFNLDILNPILLTGKPRFENSPALLHLEEYFDSRPAVKCNSDHGIRLNAAVNRRAEVEEVAREILRLVRDDECRWRDIAVLVRNSDAYNPLIKTIFEDYKVPIFLDEKKSMLHHPLVEFIRSALDTVQHWHYDAVFRCIKTELLFPLSTNKKEIRNSFDKLENYVLSYGIKGKRWTDKKRWKYERFDVEAGQLSKTEDDRKFEEEINEVRTIVVEPLVEFEQKFKVSKTVREKCEALYMLLEEIKAPAKVEAMKEASELNGMLIESKQHGQAWDAIINLLDQMVEVMGEEELSGDVFSKVLEAGLENLKFSLVPPSIDQVLIGNMEHSRYSHIKYTFMLGVNDGVIPARPKENSIISEEERELLRVNGIELAPGSRQRLLDENFIIYTALTSPSKQLWLSYPLADEEGKALVPSILINRIKEMFPSSTENLLLNEPSESSIEGQLKYISTPERTLSFLGYQIQQWKKGYSIHDIWWDAYNWFSKKDQWLFSGQQMLGSIFYKNEAKPLDKELSLSLYGDHIRTSVSRMEKFQSCAFSQFLSHGLKLKEREVFRLEAPDIGELFHAALKMFTEYVQEKQIKWSDLTKEECEQLAIQMVDQLAPRIQKEILLSSERFYYIKRKLQQVVARAATVLREHSIISGFSPIGLEIGFGGKKSKLPPLTFTLENGCTMEVMGRIDRVDQAETSNGLLLRIIDYKSSSTALNISEVYYGLALQMLTYLDVVVTHSTEWLGKEADPAGVLYFHVHNPMLNKSSVPDEDEIEDEMIKRFKMKGLLLAEKESVQLMDRSLETGHSTIVPAALKKDGSFYTNSSVASKNDFQYLKSFVRKKIESIGEDITNGKTVINPYKLKNKVPCTFCSFKSVCQFDLSLEENEYRTLFQQKPDDVLVKIREEGGNDNE